MNTDISPYAVLVIKPLSVRRGDGPRILRDLLDDCNLVLVKIREWNICPTTWDAIWNISKDTESEFTWTDKFINDSTCNSCWILVLKSKDITKDVLDVLNSYCGSSEDLLTWKSDHLRYKYSPYSSQGLTLRKYDNVVYINPKGKQKLIADLLFPRFDEKDI